MKAPSIHSFEPGEIPSTMRDLSARCRLLAERAKSEGASNLENELSECSELFTRYATGIEYGVTVALGGDTVDLLLALALVEENLQEIALLAREWPSHSSTPESIQQPLQLLSQRLADLLHNIDLVRQAIPPMTTDATVSA